MGLQDKFDSRIGELFPHGGRVLLAVSGGIDSMTMASLAVDYASRHEGLNVGIAHCNFNLRGEESDSDEALVRLWAGKHGLSFEFESFDTKAYAKARSVSIEMAARELRYDFFEKTVIARAYEAVAVAHNANDNAETMILNLLRGTGVRGLRGMDLDGILPLAGSGVRLVRPLLDVSRAEIADYAKSVGLPFHEDRTNAENDVKRNKIRNLIFPIFEKINPSFLRTFGVESAIFSQAQDILDDYFEECLGRIKTAGAEGGKLMEIDVAALSAEKHADYLIHRLLEAYGFTHEVETSVLNSLPNPAGKVWYSESCRFYGTSRGSLVLEQPQGGPLRGGVRLAGLPDLDEGRDSMVVEGPGIYEFNGRRFKVELAAVPTDMKLPDGQIMGDAGELKIPFLLRRFREGDWFCPLGLKGKKKLSDFFVDLKYDRADKEKLVVAVEPGWNEGEGPERVAAILCRRIDERIKVTASTHTVLMIAELTD